jgi:hypothetical protein
MGHGAWGERVDCVAIIPESSLYAVIHLTTNDAEGILTAERNDGFNQMTGLAQEDGAKHRALAL